MRQASDGTESHPLLENIQISKSFLHTNGTESHYLSSEPSTCSAVLCSVVKCNDTIASDELWLRTQKAKQISYTGTLKKSQLKGDLEHIVLTQCSQISHLHSLSQKVAPSLRLPIRGFGTGSVVHVVSHGEGEATGRDCSQGECST